MNYLNTIFAKLFVPSLFVSVLLYGISIFVDLPLTDASILTLSIINISALVFLVKEKISLFVTKNKSLALTIIILWILTFVYVVAFILTRHGSPFVYEQTLSKGEKIEYQTIQRQEYVETTFDAVTNHFGSLVLFFQIDDSIEEFEISELNSDTGLYIPQLEISNKNPKITFEIFDSKGNRIRSISTELISDTPVFEHIFGFPKQLDSKNKRYIIKVKNVSDYPLQIGLSSNDKIAFRAKYVIGVKEAAFFLDDAFAIILIKGDDIVKNQLPLLVHLLLIISIGLVALYQKHKSIQTAFASFSDAMFVLGIISFFALISLQKFLSIETAFSSNQLTNTYILFIFMISQLVFFFKYKGKIFESFVDANFSSLFPSFRNSVISRKMIYFLIVCSVLMIGAWLRLANLGAESLYHDELTQYRAVLGLAETGKIGLYNSFTDQITSPYDRAAVLTTFSYYSTRVFGLNEFAVRLPVAIAGCLLLVAAFFVTKKLFGKTASFFVLLLLSFNPYLIYLDRFFRNYSFLTLFFFLSLSLPLIWLKSEFTEKFRLSLAQRIAYFVGILITYLVTLHFGVVQALVLIPILIMCLGVYFVELIRVKKLTFSKIHLAVVFALILLIISIVICDYMGVISVFGIRHHLDRHLDFSRLLSINADHLQHYSKYLFSFNFRTALIFILLFSVIGFISSSLFWPAIPAFSALLIFVLVAVLGDRYEDFRYISFAIPVVTLSIGAFIAQYLSLISLIKSNAIKKLLSALFIMFLVLIPTYPSFKFIQPILNATNLYTVTPQPLWNNTEGRIFIHRRAVAPDYKKAFSHINLYGNTEDIYIFSDPSYVYLDIKTQNAFSLGRDTLYVQSLLDSNEKVLLSDLIEANPCTKIWYVGTYLHLLSPEAWQLIENSLDSNIGKEIDILHFNYNSWYNNQTHTWPTVLSSKPVCNSGE